MKNETQQLIDYIKSVLQTCEDADRKAIAEAKTNDEYVPCPMKDGYSGAFEFTYLDGNEIRAKFTYYHTGLFLHEFRHKTAEFPLKSLTFLTKEEYDNEMEPALRVWLEEKVRNEPFGGLFCAQFRLDLLIDYNEDFMEIRAHVTVSDPKREETQREMIRSFLLEKRYEAMDVKSREYNPVIIDLVYVIPSFFGELPTETLKDAITAIAKKYKEADSWYFGNAVLIPLRGACNKVLLKSTGVDDWGDEQWVLTDEVLAPEKLDFLCWIALQIIGNAKDSDDRDSGERILNFISQKGYAKAKDYLKFGSGNIGKEYTHLKNKKFEAIANDIRRTVEFKVKEEDAESYGGMLDFIITLLKQGFPADYQIKINSKLKNHIPVSNLKRSKTNLFFGNAATFPELWGRMAEYVREIFDEFTYYSDAENDEAATVGSYAVYALGAADLKANREIVDWFLSKVDTEHDLNTRNFAKEYME